MRTVGDIVERVADVAVERIKAQMPAPITTDHEYLAAILDELRAIRALLEPVVVASDEGAVELKEPKRKRSK